MFSFFLFPQWNFLPFIFLHSHPIVKSRELAKISMLKPRSGQDYANEIQGLGCLTTRNPSRVIYADML